MKVWVLFHVKMEGTNVSLMKTLKAPSMSNFGTVTLQDPGVADVMSKLICPKERLKLKF